MRIDQFQIVRKQDMIFQFAGGTSGDAAVAREFSVSVFTAAFGEISWDR